MKALKNSPVEFEQLRTVDAIGEHREHFFVCVCGQHFENDDETACADCPMRPENRQAAKARSLRFGSAREILWQKRIIVGSQMLSFLALAFVAALVSESSKTFLKLGTILGLCVSIGSQLVAAVIINVRLNRRISAGNEIGKQCLRTS